jgi:hypothetical protein
VGHDFKSIGTSSSSLNNQAVQHFGDDAENFSRFQNGARRGYTREELQPLLQPREQVERIAAFTSESMPAGADLPRRG